jgi:hypothetical protein
VTSRIGIHVGWVLQAGAVILALAGATCPCAAADDSEDAIKAVAVLNFIRYSTWPAPVADPLVVGVAGRASFLDTLRATLQNRPINGHTVRVAEVKNATDAQSCQLLYFATDRTASIRPFLTSSAIVHALTIGESDRFLDLGGAVNFYLTDGHIAFEVSLDAVERAGVTVSSNLLRVGQIRRMKKRGQP